MATTAKFFAKPGDFEKLSAALKGLPTKVSNKILSKALRAGGNIIAREVKARAPVGKKDHKGQRSGGLSYPHKAGDLKRSVRVRTGKTRGKGERKVIVMVGADKGVKWKNIYYPWWVEFGHRIGKADRSDRRLIEKKSDAVKAKDAGKAAAFQATLDRTSKRKQVAKRPFFRPAFDAKKGEAQASMTKALREGIDAAWKAAKP